MRAVVFDAFGGPLEVREVPDPRPAPHGVVVEVAATGVCRSDWHAWQGHDATVTLPHVPGHELAGRVVAVGSEVARWRGGERVTVPFVLGCGHCPYCRSGQAQVCPRQTQPGFTGPGSFAERVALDHADANLVALPDDVPDEAAAALGCRVATAWRAVADRARVRAGEWVSVHGCGGLGLAAVAVAALHGARVVAVDVSGPALAAARGAGAEVLLDAGEVPDVPPAVAEVTAGGADVALDCLGSAATCADAVRSLRPRGRHVQVGLLPAGSTPLPMDVVVALELDVLGSHGMAAADYPRLLSAVVAGRLRPQDLVTRRTDLAGGARAVAAMSGPASAAGITVVLP
jgi:D-arabinose 1-dehydrogenase-like Zn-dependent alcohol dehydrogenase